MGGPPTPGPAPATLAAVSQIITGDAVVLDLRPARVPTRMMATLIDLAICGLLAYLLIQALTRVEWSSQSQAQIVYSALSIVIMFGYPITMETLTRGRTVGAYAVGLRVVRDDGGIISFRHVLLRWLAYWLVDFAVYTGFCAGLVAATLSPNGKRIGDALAGTIVIRTRSPRSTRPVPVADVRLAQWASQLEMSRVTDEHIAAARYALQRRGLMRPKYREALIQGLAFQVSRLVAPLPPPGLPPEEYLTTILAEQRRRTAERKARDLGVDVPAGWR